ncbi:biotin/lipoyl-binding protein [Chloroflexi bacterium TSY]|nr:biotin/lipoyl-binding protein [Chloroflexi bacterium TSY]
MRRWVIVLIILILVGVGGFFVLQSRGGLEGFQGQGADPTPTLIPAVQDNNEIVAEAVVVPVRYAALSMTTGGIVAEVLVAEGDLVEEGQLIARLDNERQIIAIAQAEARVASVQARYDELDAGTRPEDIAAAVASVDAAMARLAQLTEEARPADVSAAQASLFAAQASLARTLDGPDNADLISARAEIERTEAELSRAQNAYNRIKWRNDIGALPESAALQTATINYEAAKARFDEVVAGAKPSDIASAQAEVQQARASLDQTTSPGSDNEIAAAAAEVRRSEAQLELLRAGTRPELIAAAKADLMEAQTTLLQRRVELEDTELRAPFSGTIASIDLRSGEQVAGGRPIVQMGDFSEWRIETDDLTEIGVVNIQEGDSVVITIDALDDLELTGTVVRIRPLGENKQGDITYTATIVPDQSDPRIRWNMTAAVTITPQS